MRQIFSKFGGSRSTLAAIGILLLCSSGILAQSPGVKSTRKSLANVLFESSKIDSDVERDGESGILVTLNFTTLQMKNVNAQIGIRVYDGDDVLEDKNDEDKNAAGEVFVSRAIRPGFDAADYKDFQVFVPYRVLDLEDGSYSLKLDIDINYANGELIQHLAWEEFEYGAGGDDETPEGTKVIKTWIDYNVTRDGKKGMLVHVNFEVVGMKGTDALLAIRIRREGDAYLESANASFSNKDGEFEVTYSIKPGFDPAVYEDAQIFIPYNEIVIRRGNWNLDLDIDLRYDNGELIQHLTFYPFEFNRP